MTMEARDPRFDTTLREQVRELYEDEGLSLRAVAERVDRSPSRVYALLRELGVEMRPASQRAADNGE
jgi:transposase